MHAQDFECKNGGGFGATGLFLTCIHWIKKYCYFQKTSVLNPDVVEREVVRGS
jgi:hypothetical protein